MNKRRKKPKILWDRVIVAATIFIILIIILVTVISKIFNKEEKPDSSSLTTSQSEVDNSSTVSAENTINANYDFIDYDSEKSHEGELILVNNDIPYVIPEPEDLVTIYGNKNDCYYVKDTLVSVKPETLDALNLMASDFYDAKHIYDLMVISGFRSKEYQQELYDKELEETNSTVTALVALPGHSEHHTGYAIDFGIYPSDGVYRSYDGTGDYAWINDNCYEYGFILRYQEDKEDITGIDDEPWHFRYVGQPHALLISRNDFCLEEYIDYLKDFTFGNEHLEVTDSNDVEYEIYYVPADDLVTKIPVPKDKDYYISGNNVDGFIVTITK